MQEMDVESKRLAEESKCLRLAIKRPDVGLKVPSAKIILGVSSTTRQLARNVVLGNKVGLLPRLWTSFQPTT
jgi:hypothetical protein